MWYPRREIQLHLAHAREVFVPSQHHRDLQDKQCQLSQMHLVESVGSDQRDGLTERAMGGPLDSFGTQPVWFLRVLVDEQHRNRHGGKSMGTYAKIQHQYPILSRGNLDASSTRTERVGYASPPGRPPGLGECVVRHFVLEPSMLSSFAGISPSFTIISGHDGHFALIWFLRLPSFNHFGHSHLIYFGRMIMAAPRHRRSKLGMRSQLLPLLPSPLQSWL